MGNMEGPKCPGHRSSSGNPGRLGFGVALRNDSGDWFFMFVWIQGTTDAVTAEVQAVLLGMRHALNLGYSKISCYTDSKEVIRLLGMNIPSSHRLAATSKNIHYTCKIFQEWTIAHIIREGNQVADSLARRGSKDEEFFLLRGHFPVSERSD